MNNFLVYWRDFNPQGQWPSEASRSVHWHSSSGILQRAEAGDRVWLVTSGAALNYTRRHAGFLVAVWTIQTVADNPGDDLRYPCERYRHRLSCLATCSFPPIDVDDVFRTGRSNKPIGTLIQGPRRLRTEQVTALSARLPEAVRTDAFEALSGACANDADTLTAVETEIDHQRIALGIRQPWLELILRGFKRIEVRSMPTAARGRIYLYASRKIAITPAARRAAQRHGLAVDDLPRGCLAGSVEIVECRASRPEDAEAACLPARELHSRYSWLLANPWRLVPPREVRYLPYGKWFYPFQRKNGETT